MYLKKIAEQIQRRHNQGDPSRDDRLEKRELYLHIIQAINKRLKMEHFNVNMPLGEQVPPHASIATYDLPLTSTGFSTTEFTQENIGAPLTDQFYQHPNGQFYLNPNGDGSYWVAAPASATLTITETFTSVYLVYLEGFSEINGISYQDIVDFLIASSTFIYPDKDTGYIEIQGLAGADTYRFATDGIINAFKTDTGFAFTYNLTKTVNTNATVLSAVNSSHLSIGTETGATAVSFVSIDLYTLTTNTQSDIQVSATLPAQPINLPRGMGVWRVYSRSNPTVSWIPLQSGNTFLMNGILEDSVDLLNTYEYHDNKTLYFNATVAELPSDMQVQLIVVDPDQIGETDLLPIPADMEELIIIDVLQIVGQRQQEDNSNDGNPDIR